MSRSEDPRFATTLAHGLALLEAFQRGRPALLNHELSTLTGLSKATVSRLTSTLQARDLLAYDADSRRYRLATGALTVGYPLLAALPIRLDARAAMQALALELGGSVSIGLRSRTRMVYLETSRGNDPIAFRPELGAALPMLQTAMGRAWLASVSAASRDAVLREIGPEPPDDDLMIQLEDARRGLALHGFCSSFGEWQHDVVAVAVPLGLAVDGEPLILNCGVPRHRYRRADLRATVGPKLVVLARRIEALDTLTTARRRAAWPSRAVPAPASSPTGLLHARTLARGLDLLLAFAPGEVALRATDLGRRLAVEGPTIARLTYTLVRLGYLRREAAHGGYAIGAAALTLAHPLLADMRLRRVARPAMLEMAQRLGVAVSLGVRHRTHIVYVETAWPGDERSAPPDIGASMPMLETAIGRAWLCSAPVDERRRMLNRLQAELPGSRLGAAAIVAAALREFGEWGGCTSCDYRPDIVALATPFRAPIDGERYVMNCGVLASRASTATARLQVAPLLIELVRSIESELG